MHAILNGFRGHNRSKIMNAVGGVAKELIDSKTFTIGSAGMAVHLSKTLLSHIKPNLLIS